MAVHHPGAAQTIGDLKKVIKQMVAASIQNGAIGRAGLRVYDGGWINIENGGLRVIGSAIIEGILDVTGKLTGSGTLDWTGPWKLKGKGEISGDTTGTGRLDWTGPWKLAGSGEITGDAKITKSLEVSANTRLRGPTTMEANLSVTGDGKITVGDMVIDPSYGDGAVTFANGTKVYAYEGGVAISQGSNRFQVTTNGIYFTPGSIPQKSKSGITATGILHLSALGQLCRT